MTCHIGIDSPLPSRCGFQDFSSCSLFLAGVACAWLSAFWCSVFSVSFGVVSFWLRLWGRRCLFRWCFVGFRLMPPFLYIVLNGFGFVFCILPFKKKKNIDIDLVKIEVLQKGLKLGIKISFFFFFSFFYRGQNRNVLKHMGENCIYAFFLLW